MKSFPAEPGLKAPSNLRFWLLFALLTSANAALSYASVPDWTGLLILLLGVLVPVYVLSRVPETGGKEPFYRREFLPSLPAWAWGLLIAAGLVLRFWKITTLFRWPMGDEGLSGMAAIGLARHWNWDFFQSVGQSPPLLDWVCGLFFRAFHDPFFNLWMPPALFSGAALFLGLVAARSFFSRSFAFLAAGLLAFSYWPLYLGRFCLQGVLVPAGELLALWMLGRFFEAPPGPGKARAALALGLAAGLNSFTFPAWPLLAAAVAAAVAVHARRHPGRGRMVFLPFSAGLLAALLPFLTAVFRHGYGQHIWDVAAWNRPDAAAHWVRTAGGYLSVLVWGLPAGGGFYVPGSGGFLNPLLASLFFLGLARAARDFSRPLVRWVLAAGLLFLVPGFLSLNVEGFRVVLVLPLLLFLAAWGLEVPLSVLSRRGAAPGPAASGPTASGPTASGPTASGPTASGPTASGPTASGPTALGLAAILLILTAAFDFGRLSLPYRDVAGHPGLFLSTGKSLARYRAYGVLKDLEKSRGPGWILAGWDLPADRTLEAMTYGFNAARNPVLDFDRVRWLAVMTDAHYRPFLQRRFPRAQWWELDADLPGGPRGMLGVIPAGPSDRGVLERWARADRAFRDINWATDHLYDKGCLQRLDGDIRRDYPLVQGDPFLESAFWEKVGQFYYYDGGHYAENLRALELAVQRGYPASHLYAGLSELYALGGRPRLAAWARGRALASEKEYPWR